MTKFSKVLTIFVTVMCVVFMGVTAVTSIARTDWKAELAKYPSATLADQAKRIQELNDEIKATEDRVKAAETAIAADITAMGVRDARWVAELNQKLKAAHDLAASVEAQAVQVQAKLDEGKLRREEVVRLTNQYEELVAQKEAAQAEVRRLRDLLFQSEGNLERVNRRNELLKSEGAAYEDKST